MSDSGNSQVDESEVPNIGEESESVMQEEEETLPVSKD